MSPTPHPLGHCTCRTHVSRPWRRPEHWTQADRNRVARSLRSMGYERYRERGDKLEWRYRKRKA